MLIENIRKRVQEVATLAMLGDLESAASVESTLHVDFIKYVEICAREKSYDSDMERKAAAVLSTTHIKFNRLP